MNRRTFLAGVLATPVATFDELHEKLNRAQDLRQQLDALQGQMTYVGQTLTARLEIEAHGALYVTLTSTTIGRVQHISMPFDEAKQLSAWIQGL